YALFSIPGVQYAFSFLKLYNAMKASPDKKEAWSAFAEELKQSTAEHFKDYHKPTDERLFTEMLILYSQNIAASEQPSLLAEIKKKYKGKTEEESIRKYAADVYKKSKLTSKESTDAFLNNLTIKALEEEPLFAFLNKTYDFYQTNVMPKITPIQQTEKNALKQYIAGLREFQPDRKFYPDANSTLRLTYGKVLDYNPRDGVHYLPFTTLKGVAEKEKPKDPEFDVPAKLMELYRKKDYGVYGVNGEMPVAFLTDNDITGGNSGSPVINGKGQLIGLAFDGNWEAMTGDLVFDKQYKRTISNHTHYILFIIDKFAGAGHLVKEMKLEFQ
ncbi:MAG: S46 family peptidase, partial [Bacteroidia bacterium]|nr:S46 family peptidase [Bacteroidia bacterium]